MATDYDKAKLTKREKLAGERQKTIGSFNAESVKTQLERQLANYDMANKQNRRLADVQLTQNSRKSEADRFEAQRQLQNATLGLLGSMNQAMNGSTIGNLMRMLENRSDADNQTYWTQLQANQDSVNNAYQESFNQNQAAKNDAVINAAKAGRDLEADTAANLNNINPKLFITPGTGVGNYHTNELYNQKKVAQNNAQLSGYLMPDNSVQNARKTAARNTLRGNDYYSRLINGFNRR